MGKFSKYSTAVQPKEPPWKMHPVWQGIGCLMMVLIPVLSYAGAVLLVEANVKNGWVAIPREFIGPKDYPLLYTELGVTVLLSLFGFMFFVIIYSLMYRMVGPSRQSPLDAPPIRRRRSR